MSTFWMCIGISCTPSALWPVCHCQAHRPRFDSSSLFLSVQTLSADKPSSPFKSKVDLLTHLGLNLLQFSFRFKSCILKTLTPNPSLHQRDINEARGPAWPTSFHILLYSPDFARKMSTSVCVCTRVCVCVSVVRVFVFPYNTLCKLFR